MVDCRAVSSPTPPTPPTPLSAAVGSAQRVGLRGAIPGAGTHAARGVPAAAARVLDPLVGVGHVPHGVSRRPGRRQVGSVVTVPGLPPPRRCRAVAGLSAAKKAGGTWAGSAVAVDAVDSGRGSIGALVAPPGLPSANGVVPGG